MPEAPVQSPLSARSHALDTRGSCKGGTYSNATGLASERGCLPVPPGFWSPTGSTVPIPCPTSGFICPGAAFDTVNDPPASLPTQLDAGSLSTRRLSVIEVPQLRTTLTLEQDIVAVDRDDLKLRLSAVWGVPSQDIELRSISPGSIVVSVGVAARRTSDLVTINASLSGVTDAQLSHALGVNVTRQSRLDDGVVNVTNTEVVPEQCAAGFWCTANTAVACLKGFYNPHIGADNGTACIACPPQSTTLELNSTSIDDCVCEAGFYRSASSGSFTCEECPAGTDCSAGGVTLRSLPLRSGYYRLNRESSDVRRCPDESYGEASGCRSGNEAPCLPTLTGPFCGLCAAWSDNSTGGNSSESSADAGHVYYVAASGSVGAHCTPCGNTLATTIALACVALALLLALGAALMIYPPPERVQKRIESASKRLTLAIKFKIVIAFYMIATKTPSSMT